MAARGVCGLSATMEILEPTSAFTSVDLPVLGRPRMVTKPLRVFIVICRFSLADGISAVGRGLSRQQGCGTEKPTVRKSLTVATTAYAFGEDGLFPSGLL